MRTRLKNVGIYEFVAISSNYLGKNIYIDNYLDQMNI